MQNPALVNERTIQDISLRIVKAFAPDQIVLFGSYAWGSPTPESDIDLFVIMNSTERPALRGAAVHRAAATGSIPMDPLVYTPTEVHERMAAGDLLVNRILAEGRTLYSRVNSH